MTGGTKLAVAIAMLFVAMVGFFIAFHPGAASSNGSGPGMLQWLMSEFESTVNGTASTGQSGSDPSNAGASSGTGTSSLPAPGVGNSSNFTNTSNVGPTTNRGTNPADFTNVGG
jgi:hypothetical protein